MYKLFLQCAAIATHFALAAPLAQAQVYKCLDQKTGETAYSDIPCSISARTQAVNTEPNVIDASGSREQALKKEIDALRDELRVHKSSASASNRSQADLQAERIDSRACEQARRSYDIEAGSLKQNKAAIESKRAAMYGACGMQEPDKVEINNTISPAGNCWRVGQQLVCR
ncbi:DUF4124 domain-containing protein [Parazoarcus communis]|uniref:DUF4124 domain-containing protein n=1 Tax=Parazoarcus communis SWub3 = DSM 12120 TaxID=1121029 RepID=A0A323UX68_9RHOO|nr:DUF4124 domain-containing protein [Parazoarcus communis]NMG71169.1 DUF4124 domain-containing protein [Parazoarcus communis SWub3 = DSM 12120]PZA17067.1 hypothetical protein DNK49_07445 [Azoarcus communis] [Parazoarcus communis SWub3 = DSM 12120]